MRKDEYINEVISKIENKKARREVEKELSAHIDDRISYYTDAGYDEQTATEKAMEHMGEPGKVGRELSELHKGIDFQKFLSAKYIARFIIVFLVMSVFVAFLCAVGRGPLSIALYCKKMPENYEKIPEEYKNISSVDFLGLYTDCEEEVDYDFETEKYGVFGTWHIIDGYFKPTSRVPEKLAFSPTWILNKDWNYLYSVYGDGKGKVVGSVSVSNKVLAEHDFLNGELSKVTVGDKDITDVFTSEEIDYIRCTLENSNRDKQESDYESEPTMETGKIKKTLDIFWYYENLDGIYLQKGCVVETFDGNIYLVLDLWDKGSEVSATGGFCMLSGDKKEKMQKVMDTAENVEILFDEYAFAKEMKNSVKK